MKTTIKALIEAALKDLVKSGELTCDIPAVQVDNVKDKQHGDLASNIAMLLAKPAARKPRDLAELITAKIPSSPWIRKVEIAGPGFINIFLTEDAFTAIVPMILEAKAQYGRGTLGHGKKILVEFVSSNPTGPLHVGHGRHAAYGASLCNLLEAVGYTVHREYYVNDGGRQMDILAVSVWLRYLELNDVKFAFPANAYKGTYVIEMAEALQKEFSKSLLHLAETVFAKLPDDEPQGGDKEVYIDAVIERAKTLLSEPVFAKVLDFSLKLILADIEQDLAEFGVVYNEWFSERGLVESGVVNEHIEMLTTRGLTYRQDGALWFKSTEYGDDKDRVLERANGQRTYFANDISYHLYKFQRGYDYCIDVFGSDHHGYVPRMKASLSAAGIAPEKLTYLFMQFVTLYRNGEQAQMSTRSGSFVTLRELREEVGNDAARYFYIMRRNEQHIDFDLDLAKSHSNDNPVYYVQYAHARICSVLKQCAEKELALDLSLGQTHLALLNAPHELQLLGTLGRYPEVIETAAVQHEPHQLTNYLKELATDFHSYYNSHQFLVDDANLRNARLALILATRQICANGLQLIGVSQPESM